MNDLELNNSVFESIKHIDKEGNEYWLARELQITLEYKQWRRFESVVKDAMTACKKSNYNVEDHFANVGKMVDIGSKTKRELNDYKLSRYACYLIAQSGDNRKKSISLAKTYFAVQTRKTELLEKDYNLLTEDEKRFYTRKEIRNGNYSLNQVFKKVGVKNYDQFHNYDYKGLYNGETAKCKELRYSEDILDSMGSEKLATNLFRITQIEVKIKRSLFNVWFRKICNLMS